MIHTLNTFRLYIVASLLLCFMAVSCKDDEEKDNNVNMNFSSLCGEFSVSDSKKIVFASGNLQYCPSTKVWRFAEHQYDYAGENNGQISDSFEGYIDLFGWGTGNNPTKISIDSTLYLNFVDWGINIGDSKTWFTLSAEEWLYMTETRENAADKLGVAKVGDVNGLVILPDVWTLPEGLTFNSGVSESYGADKFKEKNEYTVEQWSMMEAAGAVFFPAAGHRLGSEFGNAGFYGGLWTCTDCSDISVVWDVSFRSGQFYVYRHRRVYGRNVRLVKYLN